MVLANGLRIIWLDAYIGQDGKYDALKTKFQTILEPAANVPPDALNVIICPLVHNGIPLLFAQTPAQAATLIETHHDKQIIFISSGSLGQHIVPFIIAMYPYVHRFYIFCGKTENYIELGMNYLSCLQMFDHETDLLIRLARDISSDIIKQGEMYMTIEDHENALKCFEHALMLNINANQIDTLNDPCLTYLKLLNGDGNNIGLIQMAKSMLQQQRQE